MAYNGQELVFIDFTGGMASNKSKISVNLNEAIELDNVIPLPDGGFTNCRGNTEFNSSAMNSGANVQGLGYFRQMDQDEWIVAVCGDKIFKSDDLDGTMDDITGAVTITGGANNIWDLLVFDDELIGFGGAPDAPWKWTGAGNASALGGSPPSADFAFTMNNRIFAGISATSTIYWPIVGDAEDWTGDGSGSATVGNLDDNQLLIGGIPLTTDIALIFKENSIYHMATRNLVSSAFPIFLLHNEVGAAGKHAMVNVDGEVYFITPDATMMSTNGSRLKSYPISIDDIWDDVNFDRLKYVQGVHYKGRDHEWIIWIVSTDGQSTNNLAIIWDLENECWLRRTTGLKANVITKTLDGDLYTGHYAGKIYKQDVINTYTLASESGANVTWDWRGGWLAKTYLKTIRLSWVKVALQQAASGTVDFKVGLDFNEDVYTKSLSLAGGTAQWDVAEWDEDSWGGTSDTFKTAILTGRGNAVNFHLTGNDAIKYLIHSFAVSGYIDNAQKGIEVR